MNQPDKSKMKLVSETRWHREYALPEPGHFCRESKFFDGSASITLEELEREWPNWSEAERIDFCWSVGQALPTGDGCGKKFQGAQTGKDVFSRLPDMLRFIMRQGNHRTWSAVALDIVRLLPKEESIPFLIMACRKCAMGEGGNLLQALAISGSPDARPMIRDCLDRLWQDKRMFQEEKHINHFAAEATHCIRYLLKLGDASPDLAEKCRALVNHPTPANRDSARNFLEKIAK